MRHNQNVRPAKASGTPSKGNGKPYANLPANNVGTMPVKLGAGKPTSIVSSSNGKSSGKASTVSNTKANLPTSNYVNTSHKLGNTMHGVGEVPAYLKGKC